MEASFSDPDEFDTYLAQSFGRKCTTFEEPIEEEDVESVFDLSKLNDNMCGDKMSTPYKEDSFLKQDTLGADIDHFGCRHSDERLDLSARLRAEEGWDMSDLRPRASTMPSGVDRYRMRTPKLGFLRNNVEDLHRVRKFHLTRKGLVKEGDQYLSGSIDSKNSSSDSIAEAERREKMSSYRILLLGASGVGKKALIREFIDPNISNHPFISLDDESDRSVSIILDGEASTLEFVDMSDKEVDAFITADHVNACVVVYSVEDRRSFQTAIDRLYEIRQNEAPHLALILVANKTDLVRTRVIFLEEGKAAAKTYDCKYIEVSAAIDHKIDELLVGILKQIRLIRSAKHKFMAKSKVHYETDDIPCLERARQIVLSRIFRGDNPKTKSCENLYVL